MFTTISPVIRQVLNPRGLARLKAGLEFSSVYQCLKCRQSGDDRVEETELIAVVENNGDVRRLGRIHARCGASEVIPAGQDQALAPEDVVNPGRSPACGWQTEWFPTTGSAARRPGILIEQGMISVEVYDVPDADVAPIAADRSARLLRQQGFVFLDPASPAAIASAPRLPNWHIHLRDDHVFAVTADDNSEGWLGATDTPTADPEWANAAAEQGAVVVIVVPPATITAPTHLLDGIDDDERDGGPDGLWHRLAARMMAKNYNPALPVTERPIFRQAVAAGKVIGGAVPVTLAGL